MAVTIEELQVIVDAKTNNAVNNLKKFNKQTDKSERSTRDLAKAMLKRAAAGAAAIASVGKLISLGKESVELYGAQIQAEQKLAAAIRTTGGNVDELLPRYKDFASSIQDVTTVGDEVTLSLIQQAKSLGVSDDKMEEATKGAIGLSKALGLGTQQSIRYVSLAMEGQFTMLQRYIPALRTASSDAEKAAIVQKAMADGFETAKAEADNSYGAIVQYRNAAGDLKEQMGAVVADGIQPFVKGLTNIAQRMTESIAQTREFKDFMEYLEAGGEVGDLGLTKLTRNLAAAEEELVRLQNRGMAGVGPAVDAQKELIAAIKNEIRAKAELSKWQQIENAERERAEKIRAAEAEAHREDLENLQAEYAKTQRGQIDALEAQIAYFESFKQGPMAVAVIENLKSQLADLTEKTVSAATSTEDLMSRMADISEEYRKAETAGIVEEFEKYKSIQFTKEELELQRIEDTKAAAIAAGVEVIKAEEWAAEQIQELNQQKLQSYMDYVSQISSAFTGLTSAIGDLRANEHERELNAINEEIEQRREAGEDYEELEKKKADITRRYKRKQWQAEKRGKLLQATINTASAVAEALPNIPLSLVIGGLGAAQIATIAATNNPYQTGGVINEPVYGVGQNTGQTYSIAEERPERVEQVGRSGGETGGDVYLDGKYVGQWIRKQIKDKNTNFLIPSDMVVA